jgi:PBSX family phage portal protein
MSLFKWLFESKDEWQKRTLPKNNVMSFSFGDPVPVLEGHELFEYLECIPYSSWYEPPLPWLGIAKSYHAAVHHASSIQLKANVLSSLYIPHRLLSRDEFSKLVTNFLIFGNGYLERRNNRLHEPMKLATALSKYVRRGRDLETYYYVPSYSLAFDLSNGYTPYEFAKGSVFHVMEPDINQDIYGLPYYLAGMSSAFLNESATLWRRLYYKNGSPGHILYITDPQQNADDIAMLREAMKQQKGPGKFRNLFLYAPNGKKDGVQVLPVGEVMTKDEFLNVKTLTRDDQLATHRTPPQLLGVVPANTGGFGDTKTAALVYATNELEPLGSKFQSINEWMGEEVISFKPYSLATLQQAA